MTDLISLQKTLPPIPAKPLVPALQSYWQKGQKTLLILDDDPTGTQTVQDVPVLTVYTEEAIEDEVKRGTAVFFILTNSRSLPAAETKQLHENLGRTIRTVFGRHQKEFLLLSRADSTLRGHFPLEVNALAAGLEWNTYHAVLAPAFFEGGRYTVEDTHYLSVEGKLVPVAETDFAGDHTFGYRQSHLPRWVEEKTGGAVKAEGVVSFGIDELRKDDTAVIAQKIKTANADSVMVVNAAAAYDLQQFALAFLQSGSTAIFRTAASFINALTGIEPAPPLPAQRLRTNGAAGGLIVVGSHVQKTNRQLLQLLSVKGLVPLELPVELLFTKAGELAETELKFILCDCLQAGKDVVLYTSRQVAAANDKEESLRLATAVSARLVALVASLKVAPRFLIAKGGITSSDIATHALQIKRALVLGQALPGVPVWAGGADSKFPDMPYIIFPGNVGTDEALKELYLRLKTAAPVTAQKAGKLFNRML